jgi:hypothetical protein
VVYFKSKQTRNLRRLNHSLRMQIHGIKYGWRTIRRTFPADSVLFRATKKGFT